MVKSIIHKICILIGLLSLVLGTIGIFFPLLPTTPFYLLTTFMFAKGSKRFHDWFTATSLYKKHLESFATSRSMTLKTKLTILFSASAMLIIAGLLVRNTHMWIFIGVLMLIKYTYFFTRIKTIPEPRYTREENS